MDQYIFGLEVSMDDAHAVQVLEPPHQVHHVLNNDIVGERGATVGGEVER